MKLKSQIMDEAAVRRSLARMTHEIIEKNRGVGEICLLGIQRRGLPLARMLAENIRRFEGVEVPVGQIDITRFRDDRDCPAQPECRTPGSLPRRHVILVDDVICTGRTARAAIEAVFSRGRPQSIQLAVLIDRGHRELPIRPDFVGKNIPTARSEFVSVRVPDIDGETGVHLYDL